MGAKKTKVNPKTRLGSEHPGLEGLEGELHSTGFIPRYGDINVIINEIETLSADIESRDLTKPKERIRSIKDLTVSMLRGYVPAKVVRAAVSSIDSMNKHSEQLLKEEVFAHESKKRSIGKGPGKDTEAPGAVILQLLEAAKPVEGVEKEAPMVIDIEADDEEEIDDDIPWVVE
jgi:hypothetical protein